MQNSSWSSPRARPLETTRGHSARMEAEAEEEAEARPADDTVEGSNGGGTGDVSDAHGSRARPAEDPPADEPSKKKRGSSLQVAQDNVKNWNEDIKRCNLKLDGMRPAEVRDGREKEAANALQGKIADRAAKLIVANKTITELQEKQRLKDEAEAARAEESANISDAATILLVRLRLKHEKEIGGSALNNEKVWKDKIHATYEKAVSRGELPLSDRKSIKALKAM